MSKILDSLYLGSYGDAKNQPFLEKNGISHIVVVGVELKTLYPKTYKYMHIPAYDHPSFRLDVYFDQIADFIHNAIEKEKGAVLVHCYWGISRSTAAVLAYLIKYRQMPLSKARLYVKSRRGIISPNEGFLKQLQTYAKKLGVFEAKSLSQSFGNTAISGFFPMINNNRPETPKQTDLKVFSTTTHHWKPSTPDTNPFIITSNRKPVLTEESKSTDKGYYCRNCATLLFNESDVEHDPTTSSSNVCTVIYVKYLPWIGFTKTNSSKIFCPSSRCNAIIGFTNARGGKCPCGKRIDRMYGLYPIRLMNSKHKLETSKSW